jgi:hypothetical protein
MEYFILKPNGEQTGTFSIEQIRAMLEQGVIGPATKYWHEGIEGWRPIDRIEESLNFQPSAPTAQKSVPAQPAKLPVNSRAILRPNSLLKKSSPISRPVETVSYTPPRPEAPPSPTRKEIPPQPILGPEPARTQIEPAAPVVIKKRRVIDWIIYAASVAVVALAIDFGGPLVHTISDLFRSDVTLKSDETYVLLDQAAIKPFSDDMRNFPALEALRHQMEQATDPGARARLDLALQKATTFHTNEVEQRYLGMRKAELIEPGAYQVLKRFDDQGNATSARTGPSIWYAISYQGQTVYAHKAADSPQTAAH